MLSSNCVTHLAVFSFGLSKQPEQAISFEIASVWIQIIIYQADTVRHTHRTTEASFTCPLGHKLLFLLAQHQTLLAQAIGPGVFSWPSIRVFAGKYTLEYRLII